MRLVLNAHGGGEGEKKMNMACSMLNNIFTKTRLNPKVKRISVETGKYK